VIHRVVYNLWYRRYS